MTPIYLEGWDAVDRDAIRKAFSEALDRELRKMTNRQVLPHRRASETATVRHGDRAFDVTFGRRPDGTVGEVFVSGPKAGSSLEAVARDGAVLLSLALQHGMPLEVMRHAITREANGEPSTIIGRVLDLLAAERV